MATSRLIPAEDLDTPQRFSYLPKFLTEDEINRLFAAPDIATEEGIRDRAMLEIMYATGLRVSELVDVETRRTSICLRVSSCVTAKEARSAACRSERARFTGCSSTRR